MTARILLVPALLVTLVLAACTTPPPPTPAPSPRPVTSEEAQLLAITRFTNFEAGSRPFSASVLQAGTQLTLRGWVDYGSLLGYAAVTGDFETQALLWTARTVGIVTHAPDAAGNPTLPIPELASEAWRSHPIDPSSSELDALLSTVGNLGSDRPDNPVLVQQSGALWVRSDEVEGTPVTVFAAPPSDEPVAEGTVPELADAALLLWVDSTGLLLRAEVRLGSGWTTVDFPDASAPRLSLPDDADG